MVDISTAMAAAQVDRGKRKKGEKKERKGRSGRDHGLEPFDPEKYVLKERAEAASMWLVIGFALLVSAIMRWVILPTMDAPGGDVLWFGPMALIALIPSIHRMVMPDRFKEHYTKGTWFKAAFLFTFSWLAFSFLFANPPLGDLVGPEPSADWTVLVESDDGFMLTESGLADSNGLRFIIEGDDLSGTSWLMFGLADNDDPSVAALVITLESPDGTETTLVEDLTRWDELMTGITNASQVNGTQSPVLIDHTDDRRVAVNLGQDLGLGVWKVHVEATDQGSPWPNTAQWTWELVIEQPEVEA